MRILLLTDSLGLPRANPEQCNLEETWPELLRQKKYTVSQVSIGGATTDLLLKQLKFYRHFKPDVVILQVGIVDCAPRFMSKLELEILRSCGIWGKGILHLSNKKWVKKLRKITYTTPENFRNNLKKIQKSFSCPKIFVGIIPATIQYEYTLPGVGNNINLYNTILQNESKYFIDTTEVLEKDGLMTDNHHLNKVGHQVILRNILLKINQLKISKA